MVTIYYATATIGANEITNLIRVVYRWRTQPDFVPQLVINTTNPIGFYQPHKWIEGEIHLSSEAYDALISFLNPQGDNEVVIPFIINGIDENGKKWTWTFNGALLIGDNIEAEDERRLISVVPFVAINVFQAKGDEYFGFEKIDATHMFEFVTYEKLFERYPPNA